MGKLYNEKHKIMFVLAILISIVLFIISFVVFVKYKSIISAVLTVVFAIMPFIMSGIYYSYENTKYQIIMSIVYHKYIESNDDWLRSVINSHSEYTYQVRQAYDELFEKMTPEEWQQACEKFYKLKEEFEENNKLKEEQEELEKRIKYKSIYDNQEWLFDYHLKGEK